MDLYHPIKVVARRTGLSQHVIRVWEKRYGAVEPSRTETNRRLYSDAEIERLHLLCQLTKAGHGICRIARLSTDQLRALCEHAVSPADVVFLPDRPVTTVSTADPKPDTIHQYLDQALEAIRTLDDEALDRVLEKATIELGHQGLLQKVVGPLVCCLGEKWEDGSIKVAHEHFASAALRTFLSNFAKPCSLPESAPIIIVATPSGQNHELGAVLVAAAATSKGWRVKYLGTNLPACELSGAALQSKARAVALSVVYPDDDPDLIQQFINLRKCLPPEVAILVGGRAAESYADAIIGIGGCLLTDLPQLYRKLDELRSNVPRRRLRSAE